MLDVMITDQTEDAPLREDRGVIVDRAITEAEEEARGDTIALHNLGHVARGEALAFESFQDDKAMRGALGMADRDGVGVQAHSEQGDSQEAREAGRESVHGRYFFVYRSEPRF